MLDFFVLCPRMPDMIPSKVNDIDVIIFQWNVIKEDIILFLYTKELRITTLNDNILCLNCKKNHTCLLL